MWILVIGIFPIPNLLEPFFSPAHARSTMPLEKKRDLTGEKYSTVTHPEKGHLTVEVLRFGYQALATSVQYFA
jgi:hypothetical protein